MKTLICIFLFSLSFSLFSQDSSLVKRSKTQYFQLMRGHGNFYEAKEVFERYWEGEFPRKGAGYNPFKRWEWFWKSRKDTDGNLPLGKEYRMVWEKIHGKSSFSHLKSGAKWEELGPTSWQNRNGWNPGIGRVNTIAFDPENSNVVYVGAPSAGVWKTTTGSGLWSPKTDHLPMLGVSSLAVNPDNSSVVYAGTGDRDGGDVPSQGLIRSVNAGENWGFVHVSGFEPRVISKVDFNSQNPDNILFSGSNSAHQAVFYYSENSGVSWKKSNFYDSNLGGDPLWIFGEIRDFVINPDDPSVVFAISEEFSHSSRVFKSTNYGKDFYQVTSGLPAIGSNAQTGKIALAPSNPDIIYIVFGDSDGGLEGVYLSNDMGQNFMKIYGDLNLLSGDKEGLEYWGQASYDLAVVVNPTNEAEVYIAGINVWKSVDYGESFTIVSHWYSNTPDVPYVHADIHSLNFIHNELYACTDGGIWSTGDGGKNWVDKSAGLSIHQPYRIAISSEKSPKIISGSQDNGTNEIKQLKATHLMGGDGMNCEIDPINPKIYYASAQNGYLNRYDELFTLGKSITPFERVGEWVTPYFIHPQNPEILFAGYDEVYKSINRGNSWEKMTNHFMEKNIDHLDISHWDTDYLYAVENDAMIPHFLRSSDGGNTWENIQSYLPNSSENIIALEVDDQNGEKLWIVQPSGVYQSDNGGISWDDISKNLHALEANFVYTSSSAIKHQYGSDDLLYLGTDLGIFYKDEAMNSWVLYNNGLPVNPIMEFEINYEESKLYVATYGRGIWSTETAKPTSVGIVDQENIEGHTLKLFPVPSSGSLYATTQGIVNGKVEITITTVEGKPIYTEKVVLRNEKLYKNINIHNLNQGKYIMQITGNGLNEQMLFSKVN